MVVRRPVVSVSGLRTELPPGDTIVGASPGNIVSGSGVAVDGAGNLGAVVELDVAIAPNPSGLIIVGNKLANDGSALRTAQTALASGNQALEIAEYALASGNAAIPISATALASGNAALVDIAASPAFVADSFTAASTIAVSNVVGLDDTYRVQAIRNVEQAATDPVVYSSTQASVFGNTNTQEYCCYQSNQDKFIVVYRDDSGSSYNGVARLCTVDSSNGDCATAGSATSFHANFSDGNYVVDIPGTANFLVTYRNGQSGTDDVRVVVGAISGTSITFGTYANVTSGNSSVYCVIGYDSARSEFIFNYYRNATSTQYYKIGTVSGTTPTLGGEIASPFTNDIQNYACAVITDLGSSNLMFTQRDTSNSNYGTSIIGTNDGSSITFGTKYVFESNSTASIAVSYDSANSKALIAYRPGGGANADDGVAKVASISGTTITFGTLAVFAANITISQYVSSFYDSDVERHVITYADADSSNYPKTKCAIVTGTTVTYETATTIYSFSVTDYVQAAYRNSTNQNFVTLSPGNLLRAFGSQPLLGTSTIPTVGSQQNFIGIAQTAAASGSAVTVAFPGSAQTGFTGLLAGSGYYVDPTTSGFTTTSTQPTTWSGAVNWGVVGRAVNSTTLLLTDML